MALFLFDMKTFIPFLAFCLISFKPSHYEYEKLFLIYESTIIISGETNVGAFNCQSCNTQIDTLTVSYFENDVHSYQIKHPPIELSVNAFDCGGAVITKDFGKLLQKDIYPALKINFKKVRWTTKNQLKVGKIDFEIEIAGVKKRFIADFNSSIIGGVDVVQGVLDICITDFNLIPHKKILGLIKVSEDIQIRISCQLYSNYTMLIPN